MANNKKWTADEDAILVSNIKQSPTNLAEAFRATSKKINRSESACAGRWYTTLSKNKANACFITVSGKHHSLNRKNSKGVKCTPSLFTRILKVLGIVK